MIGKTYSSYFHFLMSILYSIYIRGDNMEISLQVFSAFLSGVLSIAVGYLARKLKKESEKREIEEAKIIREEHALREGIRAILKYRLLNLCQQCHKKGYISNIEELENINDIYQAYIELNGNGTASKVYSDVIKLPIKSE